MRPDPKHDDTVSKNDFYVLNDLFTKFSPQESLLSISYSQKRDGLVLQSQSPRFLDRFCSSKMGFEAGRGNDTFHSIRTYTGVLKHGNMSAARFTPFDPPCYPDTDAVPNQLHSDQKKRSDAIMLTKLLAKVVCQDSLLSMCYEEITDSLVIKSESRLFLKSYKEQWSEKLLGGKKMKIGNRQVNLEDSSKRLNRAPEGSMDYKYNIKPSYKYFEAFVNGDCAVLGAFRQRYFPLVAQMVLNREGSIPDAEEVFHEAWIYVFERAKAGRLKVNTNFGGYFCRVCINKWYDLYRRSKKTVFTEFENTNHYGVSEDPCQQEEELAFKERRFQLIDESFEKLGTRAKELVILWLEGNSWIEAAAKLHIAPGFAKKYKCLILKRLRTLIRRSPNFTPSDERIYFSKKRQAVA
ncbi:sigma-70 family RNA polymerase sigma factor [Segetibacter sp. 3557_3]|uniref:RNA polymerase sigma factor n=1 Tax=Segetibacter sp. 3557_3 TaxID=2547429 RepID=UPI001058B6F6|nr:sigma-70 family RNA polymerase sigma factor [Segetibacter sp. 3557_3]TDH18508.1 sigma-70 family RNA polymerase sigma factor [Segetibacter sp. 3557_3]